MERPTFQPEESQTDRALILSFAERLGSIDAKIDELQKPKKKDFAAKAGILGLIVSLLISLFTLFDRVYTKPHDEAATEYTQLKTNVRAIAALNEDLGDRLSKATDGSVKAFLMQTVNLQVQSYLQDSIKLIKALGEDESDDNWAAHIWEWFHKKEAARKYLLSPSDYLVLSNASYAAGDFKNALRYSNNAKAVAGNFHESSQTVAANAIMLVQTKGRDSIPEARRSISDALVDLQKRHDFGIEYDVAFMYVTLAAIDGLAADCKKVGEDSQSALQAVAANPGNTPGQLANAVAQTRCPISVFPEPLQSAVAHLRAVASGPADGVAATPAGPPIAAVAPAKLTTICAFDNGPRAGQRQSYAGVAPPVPVGIFCQDGQGSTGKTVI